MIDLSEIRSAFSNCPCGMNHTFGIKAVEVGSGITVKTGEILKANGFGRRLLFIADGNTIKAAEGIIPAPESCHAIAATIREAKKCIETGEEKTILFCLSGHGLIDMAAYDQYLAGNLINNSISDEVIAANIQELTEKVPY